MSDQSELLQDILQPIRESSLELWQSRTRRDCSQLNDDIVNSYECKWQDKAVDEFAFEHVSIYCSLGDWASNISDILKNPNFDLYSFSDDEYCLALFRYFTRLFLVVSEILVDFEQIVQIAEGVNIKRSRSFLSSSHGKVDSFLHFVNTICKHKVEGLHICNHHLPIRFEDSSIPSHLERPITMANVNLDNPDAILLPRLSEIIEMVLHCYIKLDELFNKDSEKFLCICEKFGKPFAGEKAG